MTNRIDYNSLIALKAIHEQGSFVKAANSINVTQSAISQRIKSLESHVGSPVIKRGSKLELTEVGAHLITHINKVSDLERDLNEKIPQLGIDQTSIRIAVNADSLATWWFTHVEKTSKELNIRFDIVVADQDSAISKMEDGEVLACLCSSEDSLPGAKALPVKTMNYRMYANKEFYDKYFKGNTLSHAIKTAPAILYGRDDKLHDRFLSLCGYESPYPYHHVPDAGGLAQAIVSGMGYGMLADEQLELIQAPKDLVNIQEKYCIMEELYWHYWRNSSDILSKFSMSLP